jgi:uncharacterized membrane protein YeaQ/YmgE (transglycosylase-associated protein family)
MEITNLLQNPIIQKILVWILLGLGVGLAAKILMPGRENMGWIKTIFLGLTGSFLGNYFAPKLLSLPLYSAFSWQGIAIGISGALILVLINRIVTGS